MKLRCFRILLGAAFVTLCSGKVGHAFDTGTLVKWEVMQ